ncbi:unnamed protein product [Vitrella brassicaformis CCMP3155]|uniref:Uncharacterized protein n=1 Tax=Vitrella brassicaformis (strain CCMP3155) TaxID=1169540 RepID=A0A0G4E990_VITBC|nr:unnamed protein product [Vitrella brassicaformis CCMP3155]|eukprot:CEL91923.1 unnamed protein product [Vitrella brassicaformis CCMP3155]
MAAAAASSSSAGAAHQAEVMGRSASSRYKEGTRVVSLSSTRRAPTNDYVWVTAKVYRVDPHVVYMKAGTLHEGTALYMREVGGSEEEFKVLKPHQTNTDTQTHPQAPVVWDASKKAPERFGEDLLASFFSFMTPRELSAIFPPPRSTDSIGAATPAAKPRPRAVQRVSAARPNPTTTTTTAPAPLFAGIFAPAQTPSTSQSTATPASCLFELGKASTGGVGDLFHGGAAASGGGSLFGEVGSTSSGTGRGSLSGQGGAATGTAGMFGGSISGGAGECVTVAATSSFSGPSFSARGSMLGGPAFGQQPSGGATRSSPSLIHTAALHQQTHVAIDSSTDIDRHFWDNMTTEKAFQLGKRLVNLTALTLVQPRRGRSWCLGSMINVVEGHAAGRREAREKEGQRLMAEGSLETIDFTTAPTRTSRSSPPSLPVTQPPTLHALRAVTGAVHQHSVLADRGWKMPALEYVDQDGWGASELGRFVSSSPSLKEVGGRRRSWGQWATLFEHFPEAPDGQPGPLSHLQSIGGIEHPRNRQTSEITRLQNVLSSRGCRKSLTSLDVELSPFRDHDDLSALLAVDRFINTCCTSPDVPLYVTVLRGIFNLAVFYADAFPRRPSPFIKTAIKEAARQTRYVYYRLSQHDVTHPLDDPSPAATDIASSLSFDEARRVSVHNANGFAPPPGTPPPAPAIINDLQQFPRAGELYFSSRLGVAAGRLLAQRMPREVVRVLFDGAVSAQDRIGVLEGLGAWRDVNTVRVGELDWVSLTQGGAFDGWGSNGLPSISNIGMQLEVPHELEASAAANIIRDGLSSLLSAGLRGLRVVKLRLLDVYHDLGDVIRRELLPHGTRVGGFTINTPDNDEDWCIVLVASRDP